MDNFELFSDLYKDVNGVRPRFVPENLEAEIERLHKQLEIILVEERRAEEKAVVDFELRVEEIIKTGAGNRERAIQWLMQANRYGHDEEALEHQFRLPYGYLGRG